MSYRHLFVIGAQRSGTSYLRMALDFHPSITMIRPARPEPKYFLQPGAENTSPDDYRARWFAGPLTPILGEKSTSYLEDPSVAGRIDAVFPDARFLVVLRAPIDRALSHYRFSVDGGLEPLPVEEALRTASEDRPWDRTRVSVSPFRYLSRGFYSQFLEPWIERIGRDRMQVMLFEEMIAGLEWDRLWSFVGVEAINLQNLLPQNASVERDIKLRPEHRAQLVQLFDPWNRRLAALLGRDLSGWNR